MIGLMSSREIVGRPTLASRSIRCEASIPMPMMKPGVGTHFKFKEHMLELALWLKKNGFRADHATKH